MTARFSGGFSAELRTILAIGLIAAAVLIGPGRATADVGVVTVDPPRAAPGDRVAAWLGCGSCLAASVAQGPRHPPPSFPVSLVPAARTPEPKHCGKYPACGLFSNGPPRKRPYTFLGLAKPTFHERELEEWPCCGAPKYRLRFRIPAVEPGRHAFVIYCEGCLPGPRGSLIVDTVDPDDGLRVLPGRDEAAAGDGSSGAGPWIAGPAIAVLGLVAWLGFRRRRAAR